MRCTFRRTLVSLESLVSLAAAAVIVRPAAAQPTAPGCAIERATPCTETTAFVASVVDFRTSTAGRDRLLTITMRFRNRTARTLRLVYVQGSGVVLDDQGNRYLVVGGAAGVRGIGEATANSFDAKFVLAPGESSDARFELAWSPERVGQIVGTTYEGDVAVREVDPLPGNQLRLGREHALHFRALGGGQLAGASPAAPSVPTAPAPQAAPVADAGDPCAGRARCYAAGPFVAEVTNVTPALAGRHHTLRIELKIQNRTTQPLILGYKGTSGAATDNLGNRYYWGRAGTYDVSASGIGTVTGRQADPQFVLQPGQSGRASFQLIRYDVGRSEIGTSFTYDLALNELEILPSRQVRNAREFALSFPGLTAGGASAAQAVQAGKAILDRLRGKKP